MFIPYAKVTRERSFTRVDDLGSTRQHDVKVVYYFARYLGVDFSIIYLYKLEFDPYGWSWSYILDFSVYSTKPVNEENRPLISRKKWVYMTR